MDVPAAEIRAPGKPREDLTDLDPEVETLSAHGRARRFDRIQECANLRSLWLSGLPEKKVASLPAMPKLRRLVVHDYRCGSLSALLAWAVRLDSGVRRTETTSGVTVLRARSS